MNDNKTYSNDFRCTFASPSPRDLVSHLLVKPLPPAQSPLSFLPLSWWLPEQHFFFILCNEQNPNENNSILFMLSKCIILYFEFYKIASYSAIYSHKALYLIFLLKTSHTFLSFDLNFHFSFLPGGVETNPFTDRLPVLKRI